MRSLGWFGVVVVLSVAVVAVAATTVGTQSEEPGGDEGGRAELEQFPGALQERMALIAAPRECAPRVSFGEYVRMFATAIERPPLSADQAQRITKAAGARGRSGRPAAGGAAARGRR